MFYVKRPFCQEKRHFLIQTIKGSPAFQAWVLVVFHAIFAKTSAAWLTNIHFIGWKRLITRRTFHNIYRLFIILFVAIIPKKSGYIPCPKKTKVIHKNALLNLHGEKTEIYETKRLKQLKIAQKPRKNSLKPTQNNGFCSTWNKCGQLIVSRETYKINPSQNCQNIPLFHVKRRFRKMWISFNHFASKLTYCQPIDIIVFR